MCVDLSVIRDYKGYSMFLLWPWNSTIRDSFLWLEDYFVLLILNIPRKKDPFKCWRIIPINIKHYHVALGKVWRYVPIMPQLFSYMLLNTVLHPLSFKIILLMRILPSTRLQMLKKRECLICLYLRYYPACKCSINCSLLHRREYLKSSYLNATEFIRPLLWARFDIKKRVRMWGHWDICPGTHTNPRGARERWRHSRQTSNDHLLCWGQLRKGDASLISGYLLDCHNIALLGAFPASKKTRVTLCGFGFSGT